MVQPPSYSDVVVSGVAPPPAAAPSNDTNEADLFYDWVDVHGLLDENLDLLDGCPGL